MRRNWIRVELILAFNLYCKLPFGKLHSRNPDIIKLSKILNRTPSSVALKLVNFSSLDPELKKRGISGMSNHSKLDKEIFDEFNKDWDSLILESELLYEYYSNNFSLEKPEKRDESFKLLEKYGEDKIVKTKQRVNQGFFRTMILSNYDETCVICDLNYAPLLVASHIIPWSVNEKERLNPHNGLCLCSIHDKAFDRGLISIDNELNVIISNKLLKINEVAFNSYFGIFYNKRINNPRKFYPSIEFLEYHRSVVFLEN